MKKSNSIFNDFVFETNRYSKNQTWHKKSSGREYQVIYNDVKGTYTYNNVTGSKIDIINEINRVDAKKNENMIPVYKYDVIYEDGDEGGYESPVKYDKSNKVITPEGELITIKRIRNNGKPIMMDM